MLKNKFPHLEEINHMAEIFKIKMDTATLGGKVDCDDIVMLRDLAHMLYKSSLLLITRISYAEVKQQKQEMLDDFLLKYPRLSMYFKQ
jgi:hypothetical protein